MEIIERACRILYSVLKARAPIDTGNLVTHGIQMTSDFSAVLIGNEVVDYAYFTNEPWERGTNPNQGWIEQAIEEALPLIKNACRGIMSESEYEEILNNYKDILNTRLSERAKVFTRESI